MKTEIKIPAVGESITEATIAQWVKKDGDIVKRDEIILILETDKASVEVVAEQAGQLSVKVKEGQTIAIGSIVGEIDPDKAGASAGAPTASAKPSAPPPVAASVAAPAAAAKPMTPPVPSKPAAAPLSPAVRRVVEEQHLNVAGLAGSGKDGRLTKGDLLGLSPNSPFATATQVAAPVTASATAVPATAAPAAKSAGAVAAKSTPTNLPTPQLGNVAQTTTRETMTKLRQTIARRLVEAQHTAAILTTFNEIDMTNVMALRAKYKDKFKDRYGIGLGFMGFFVKAANEALKAFPRVNGSIEGNEIVFHHYYNVGIAVGTEKGLIVPVIKNSDLLSIAEVEQSIKHYAEKARDGKISLDDLSGGTFTISNGGVYGSLMSTPILNPPQSAILGLHKIEERPVAIQGKVEIRPMMYVALSYDHRIIDGGESVSFLVKIKEGIEDPTRLLIEV